MYHSHQLKQPPSFTYLSEHSGNPNPNSNVPYPQAALQSAGPALHPPGTDPHAGSAPYSLTHAGYAHLGGYYEDPNTGSGTWGSSLSMGLTSAGSYWATQSSLNNATTSISNQYPVSQPLRCEVCNIICNSKYVFDKHISGKKHVKKLQTQLNSSAPGLQTLYASANGETVSGAFGVVSCEELELKKHNILKSGAPIDSVRVCTVCNIACNSQEVFIKHLSGRKHAAQASLMSLGVVGHQFSAIKAENNNFWSKIPKKTKVVQSSWCEVCKINCNSNDAYFQHIQGKKHQKKLENLAMPSNGTTADPSTSSIPIIGPAENPDTSNKNKGVDSQKRTAGSQSTVEDLETKKRKVVESGVAVDALRVCSVCNVVCNSETVFTAHLAGSKHATMVKKQAEATM